MCSGRYWVCLVVSVPVCPVYFAFWFLLSVCLDLSVANGLRCALHIHMMNLLPAKELECVLWIHLLACLFFVCSQ